MLLTKLFEGKPSQRMLLYILHAFSFFFAINQALATHIVGADMSYKGIGNERYIFVLNVYRDCGSTIALENKQTVYFYSVSCNKPQDSLVLYAVNDGVGIDISPVCSKVKSTCKGGTTPGVEKFTFTDTVTLTAACTDWIFYYKECNRTAGITTVVNPQLKCLYIEARLNNQNAPDNSSPSFENEPVSFVCLDKNVQLNNGAVDSNGDDLRFKLIAPRTNSALPGQPDDNYLVYKTPYSATNPLPTNGGFNFDSLSGTISFNPSQLIRTVTALRVDEYRNGVLIGSVMRDLQILVQTCDNNIPTLRGINGTPNFEKNLCAGQLNTLYFPGSDLDVNDSVRITWNNPFPGATFFSTYTKRRDSARFSWTPTLADTGLVLITLTIADNNCPTVGSSSASYKLNVKPSPKVALRSDTSLPCGITIPITAKILEGKSPFAVKWSGLTDTTRTVLLGNGSYVVTITDANGCAASDNLNILGGANTTASISIDSLCVNQLATLKPTLSGQPSGVTFTYTWKITPVNATTAVFNSTLAQPTFKFLTAGDYEISLKITGSNNCTYTTTKVVTVCSPPEVDFELVEIPCLGQPVKITLNSSGGLNCPITSWKIKYNTLNFNATGNLATLQSDSFRAGNNTVVISGKTASGCSVSKPFTFPITVRPLAKFVIPSVPFRCNQAKTPITVKVWKQAGLPNESYNMAITCPDTSFTTDFYTQDTVYLTIFVKKPQVVSVLAKMAGSTCATTVSGNVFFPITANAAASAYCRYGDTTRFNSGAQSPFGIKSFLWDLSDGQTSTIRTPKKLFPVSQLIPIVFYVEDSLTCKDTIRITVDTRLPDSLAFVVQDTICFGTAINFQYPGASLISSWTWRGISDSVTITNPANRNGSLVLKRTGVNPISVRIRYKGSCVRRILVDSVFVRRPVEVRLTLKNVCAYDTSTFTGYQVNGEFPIQEYRWNFRYLGTSVPPVLDTGETVKQLFNRNGPFRTVLWGMNTKGCTDTLRHDTTMVLVSTPSFDISGSCQGDSLFFFFGRVPDVYENIRRFAYQFGDGESTVNENGFAFHQYQNTGVYKVKLVAYSKENCLNIDSTVLTIRPKPEAIFSTGLTPCEGTIIRLDGSASRASTPQESLISRRWWADTTLIDTVAVTSTIFDSPGPHTLVHWVKSENGCTDQQRYNITVLPAPEAGFNYDPQELVTRDYLTFTNTAVDATTWKYEYGDGKSEVFNDPALASPVHYYTAGGEFKVLQIVTNPEGCSDTASALLRLQPYVALPSAFTPNGDDRNDTFILEHRLIRSLDEYKIFNRFGEVVWETTDISKAWDGTQNGNEVSAGAYVFVVKATSVFGESLSAKGTVNLIR